MRMGARILLHGVRRAAVRVALAQNRIDGAPHDLAVAPRDRPFLICLRILWVLRYREALSLQLGDRRLHLRHRCTDVRQLDDVGLRRLRQAAKLCQRVLDPLIRREPLGEVREDAACERNVWELQGDIGGRGECPEDREQRVGGQQGRFVGLRIQDGWFLGHRPRVSRKVASVATQRVRRRGTSARSASQPAAICRACELLSPSATGFADTERLRSRRPEGTRWC